MGDTFIMRRGGGGGAAGLNFSVINGAYLPKSKSKNMLAYPFYHTTQTVSGVTFTDNGDGTVTADGTCTASNYSVFRCIGTQGMNDPRQRLLQPGTYTLSGCPAGGSDTTYKMEVLATVGGTMLGVDTGAGVTFTLTEATLVRVNVVVVAGATASGLIFKPQLESGAAATEFVRYKYDQNAIWVETETEITSWDFDANQPALRSNNKNFICYPFYQTTQTTSGITYTDNGDGTIKANGTATAHAYFRCNYTEPATGLMYLRKGTYTLSGCPAGGSADTYAIEAYCNTSPAVIYRDTGAGVTFTLDEDCYVRVAVLIKTGTTVTNKVFAPQLEKGSAATSFVAGDATGQVWLGVGTSAPAAFNALQKNNIAVHPINCKQYISGAWVDKTAKTYQGGEWLDWLTYIFLAGKGALVTLRAYEWVDETATNVTSSMVTTNAIVFDGTKSSYGEQKCSTYDAVDLTSVSKIVCVATTGSKISTGLVMYVTKTRKNDPEEYTGAAATVALTANSINAQFSLDVSSLSGNYYVGIGGYGSAQITSLGYV